MNLTTEAAREAIEIPSWQASCWLHPSPVKLISVALQKCLDVGALHMLQEAYLSIRLGKKKVLDDCAEVWPELELH